MSDVTTPRAGRSQSSSRGLAVAASQRHKPKNAPFKFLRKDEGRLSYTCQPESPLAVGSVNHNSIIRDGPPSERRGSRSLREAIASDMRKGKNHDPFEAVVIAVPKRAPPPNAGVRVELPPSPETPHVLESKSDQTQQQQQQQQQQQPQQQKQQPQQQKQQKQRQQHVARRPDWIDPEIPETNGDVAVVAAERQSSYLQQSRTSEESERVLEPAGPPRYSTGPSHATPRREGEYDGIEWQQPPKRRWRNDDLADNGVVRRSTPRHYSDPVDVENEYLRGSRNLFWRPQRQDYLVSREQDLVEQLEDELRAAKEERGRYHQLTTHLERERQRFEDYCTGVERGFEVERAELDAARASGHWQAKKDVKVMEERYKSTLELLRTERESNKKLTTENEFLRQQLEGITARMREGRKLQRVETSRLRREIEYLARRNEELLELAREQQIAALESGARVSPAASIGKVTHLQLQGSGTNTRRSSNDPYDLVDDLQSEDGELEEESEVHKQLAANAEEQEHRRLELEERKRLELEERKRMELEERKRLELEERKRHEAEERECKRLELEERKRHEVEERERKRLELERRKRKEREESVRRQAEEQERRQQQQQQQQEEQRQQPRQGQQEERRGSHSTPTEEVENKTQEPRVQRRSAGHPVLTPRAQCNKTAVNEVQQRVPHRTVTSSASRGPRRTPTVAELIADDEPVPPEEFVNDVVVSQAALGENPNKREVLYRSGKREIHYANGTRKVILPSGHIVLYFTNGDVKRTFPSGKSMYWYAAAQTTHVQHADGVQVFQFHASGQIERHLPDGKKEILYPDGIYKVIFADGRDETIFPDEL